MGRIGISEYPIYAGTFVESGSEIETEIAQKKQTEQDILMEFEEKVVEVIDVCKNVKSIFGAKMKKTENEAREDEENE
jgi:hypothetical protein